MLTEGEIEARVRRMEEHIGYLLASSYMRGPDGEAALRDLHQWAEIKRREAARISDGDQDKQDA